MYSSIEHPPDVGAELKAFTLKSPWLGSAMMLGEKRIENRHQDWKPGWYAVHIGVGKEDPWCERHVRDNVTDEAALREIVNNVTHGCMPRGHIVGLVHIDYTLPVSHARLSHDRGWAMGPFCMMISHRVFLKNPIQCRGQLGAWRVLKALREAMTPAQLTLHMQNELCDTVHANKRCNISANAGELLDYKQELLVAKRARKRGRDDVN